MSGVVDELAELERIVKTDGQDDSVSPLVLESGQEELDNAIIEPTEMGSETFDRPGFADAAPDHSGGSGSKLVIDFSPIKDDAAKSESSDVEQDVSNIVARLSSLTDTANDFGLDFATEEEAEASRPNTPEIRLITPDIRESEEHGVVLDDREVAEMSNIPKPIDDEPRLKPPHIGRPFRIILRRAPQSLIDSCRTPPVKKTTVRQRGNSNSSSRSGRRTQQKPPAARGSGKRGRGGSKAATKVKRSSKTPEPRGNTVSPRPATLSSSSSSSSDSEDDADGASPGKSDLLKKLTIKYKNAGATNLAKPPPAPPVRRPPSVEAKHATPGSSDSEVPRKPKGGKEKRKDKQKQRRPKERGDLKEHRKKRDREEHSDHHDRKGTENSERTHDRHCVKRRSKNDEHGTPKKVDSNKPLAVRHASKVVSPVTIKSEQLFTVVERPCVVSTPVRSAPPPEAPKHDSPFEKRKEQARRNKFPEAVESVVDLILCELLDDVCGTEPAKSKEAVKRRLSDDDRSLPMKKRHISDSEVTVARSHSQSDVEDIVDDRDTPLRTLWIEIPRFLPRHIEHLKKRCRREAKEVQPNQCDEMRHKKDKREEERKSCIADDGTKPRLHPSQKIKKLLEEKASHLKHRNLSTDSRRVSVDRQSPDSSDDDTRASVKEEKASPTGDEDDFSDAKQEKRMSFVPLPFLKKTDGRSVKKMAKEREEQQSHKAPPVVVQAASGPTANKIAKPLHKQKGAKEEEKTKYSAYVPASTGPLPRKKGNYTSSQAILMENRHKSSSWSSANDILKNILDGSNESMKLIKHKASSKDKGAESGEKSRFEKLSVSEGASGQLPVAKVKPFGSPPVSAAQSTEVTSASSASAVNHRATGAFLEGLRNAGETAEAVKLEERYASPLEKKRMSMLSSEAKFRSGAGFYPRPQNRGRGRGGFPIGRRDPGLTGEPSSKDSLVESFMDHFKSLRDESGASDIQSIAMRAADRFRAGHAPWRDNRGASVTSDRNGTPNYASGPVLSGDGGAAKRIPEMGAKPDSHRAKGPAGPPQSGLDDNDDDFDDGGGGGDDSPTLSTIEGETDVKRMSDMGLPVQFGGPKEDDETGGFRGNDTRGRGRGRFPDEGRGFRGGFRGGRGRGGFEDEPGGFDRRGRGSFRGQARGRYNASRGFSGYGDYGRPRYEGREDPRQVNRRERWRDDGEAWDGNNKSSRAEVQDDNYKRFLSSSRSSSSGRYGAFSRSDRRRSRSKSRSPSRSRSRRRSRSRSRSRSRGKKSPRDHPQPGLDDLLKNIVGLDTPSSSRSDANGQDTGAPGYLSQLLAGSPVKSTTSAQAKSSLPVQDFPPDLAQDILQLAATDPGALLNLIETGGPQVTELLCKVVASADKPVSQEAASILQNRLTESEKPQPVPPPQPGPSHKPPQPPPLSGPAQSVLELFGGFTGNILPPPIFTAPPEETTPAPPPPQPAAASGREDPEQTREHINQLIDLFQQILGFPGSIIHMDLEKKSKVSSMIPLLVSLREVANLPGTGDTFDILPDIAQFAMELIAEPGMLQ